MIVEIGTCDFETLAGRVDGLFIEPIKYYFDRLPPCRKENVAISNYTGTADFYYVEPADIEKYKLDTWLRGCNSFGKPHRHHAALPTEIVKVTTVPVVRIKSLLDKHGITAIDDLKIDAEGHDAIILNDFFDTCDIKPKTIFFENNGLVPRADVQRLISRLIGLGYDVDGDDGACYAKLRTSSHTGDKS